MSLLKPITKRLYRVAVGSVRAANVRHYRGHGVHSPFVYSLVRQVFMRRRVEGEDTALYTELILRNVSRRRATQLQNLYSHCGYENYLIADAEVMCLDGVELCVVPRECDAGPMYTFFTKRMASSMYLRSCSVYIVLRFFNCHTVSSEPRDTYTSP